MESAVSTGVSTTVTGNVPRMRFTVSTRRRACPKASGVLRRISASDQSSRMSRRRRVTNRRAAIVSDTGPEGQQQRRGRKWPRRLGGTVAGMSTNAVSANPPAAPIGTGSFGPGSSGPGSFGPGSSPPVSSRGSHSAQVLSPVSGFQIRSSQRNASSCRQCVARCPAAAMAIANRSRGRIGAPGQCQPK